jgi:hypothetical protein
MAYFQYEIVEDIHSIECEAIDKCITLTGVTRNQVLRKFKAHLEECHPEQKGIIRDIRALFDPTFVY